MEIKKIITIRIFLWLVLGIIVGLFAYFKIVPTGKISYVNDFYEPSYFIGKLAPAERVEIGQGSALIKGDPVYFSLKTPRRFEKAGITVKFKNTTSFPVMEIGLLNDKIAWGYDLKPLENKIIDQLSLVWPVVSGPDGSRLIEREKKYDTIEKFLSNLPERNEIALYNYNLKTKFFLDKYAPQQEARIIDYSFRGAYQFYTYVKNEDLSYAFNFVDLNLNKDNDSVDIKVYSPDGLVYAKHIADDMASSSERQANFRVPNLSEGVYRINFVANDDIITKTIVSRQSLFALINKVWLASGNKKNLILYTNSVAINAQTINPGSLGKIKVGDDAIELNETYRQFFLATDKRPVPVAKSVKADGEQPSGVKIELAKDDVIISGDGVFSLSEAGLLDPRFKNVDNNLDLNQAKVNYILTNYQGPAIPAEWRTARVDFDLTKAYQENGKYQFLISIPGLKAEEAHNGFVVIKEIRVDLIGTSLRQKINKYLSR